MSSKVVIGNVEIQPVLDTNLLGDPNTFLPKSAGRFAAEYPELVDERQLITMSITCYLLRSEGKTILVDTGLGNRRRPRFPVGRLDENLAALGVTPEEVDIIVHTHLHIDHVGWNTVEGEDGSKHIFFPRAEYYIQQTEWDFWMTPKWLAEPGYECLGECVEPLTETGRIRFMDGDAAITGDLTFVAAPGHTPGHVGIGIYSAGERALLIGDASHHPVQLDHPDWGAVADVNPDQAVETRTRLFEEAIADGRIVVAGHWPHPGIGRIVRLEGKRVFQAL